MSCTGGDDCTGWRRHRRRRPTFGWPDRTRSWAPQALRERERARIWRACVKWTCGQPKPACRRKARGDLLPTRQPKYAARRTRPTWSAPGAPLDVSCVRAVRRAHAVHAGGLLAAGRELPRDRDLPVLVRPFVRERDAAAPGEGNPLPFSRFLGRDGFERGGPAVPAALEGERSQLDRLARD